MYAKRSSLQALDDRRKKTPFLQTFNSQGKAPLRIIVILPLPLLLIIMVIIILVLLHQAYEHTSLETLRQRTAIPRAGPPGCAKR